jgi:hypothetical protein
MPSSVPTDQEMLDAIRTTKHAIIVDGAQSYSSPALGRTFTALDLDALTRMEKQYEGQIARRNRPMFAGVTFRGPR